MTEGCCNIKTILYGALVVLFISVFSSGQSIAQSPPGKIKKFYAALSAVQQKSFYINETKEFMA